MNEIVNKENNSLNSSATVHTLQVIIKMTHFNKVNKSFALRD